VSFVRRGPLSRAEAHASAKGPSTPAGLDPVAVATTTEMEAGRRASRATAKHDAPGTEPDTPAGQEAPRVPEVPETHESAAADEGRGSPAEDE
jgi:hypothetical protein